MSAEDAGRSVDGKKLVRRLLLCLLVTQFADLPQTFGQNEWIVPQMSNVNASLRGIAVVDDREGWVSGSGGVVIHTVDGGRIWERVRIPDSDESDFRDIAVPEKGVVLLMSAGPGGLSRVLRSTDGGASWTVTLQNQDPAGFFNAFTFSDAQNGILIGDPIQGRLDMYRTKDGGATWRRDQGPPLQKGEYGFAASGTNVASVLPSHHWVATGGSVARVFWSTDSALNWSPVSTPIAQGSESSGIFSIAFRDPRHGIIVGGDYKNPDADNGNAARTADGGRTWTLSDPRGKIPHKACVRHITGKSWMAVGRTGIVVSDDDGLSWKHVSRESYYTFDVNAETLTGWMAGTDGRVARFTWPPD